MHARPESWEGHELEPQDPQAGDPSHKSPPTHPGSARRGGRRGGGREVLGALNSGKTSQAGARQDPEPESELEPQRRPRPFPRPRPRSLPRPPGPGGPGTPPPRGEGKGGRGARAHVLRSSGPVPAARAPPQPARAPCPSPSPLSLPPLGTMAAPSRHPLPPGRPRAFFARQSGTGGGAWAGAAGAHTPQGRPGRRKRDAGRAAGVRGPGEPRRGSAPGGKGLHRPAGCPTGQDRAGAAAPAGPARTHMACHTLAGTHTALGHTYRDVDVRTHTTSADVDTQLTH